MITPSQVKKILELSEHLNYAQIGRELKLNEMTVRRVIDPQWYEERKARMRKASKKYRERDPEVFSAVRRSNRLVRQETPQDPPPPEVLIDRDQRCEPYVETLNMRLLGDPPPGRSALDKR